MKVKLIIILLLFIGCSSEVNLASSVINPKAQNRWLEKEADKRNKILESLEIEFLNKSSSYLEQKLGKPDQILTTVINRSINYDEEWIYHYSAGVFLIDQNTWNYLFYINKNIIECVEIAGFPKE